MTSPKYFRSANGNVSLPVFFPDATRAVLKSLDTRDIEETKTTGLLVNTFHLYKELGLDFIKKIGGIKKFMNWDGAMISDSGGFQVGSLIKSNPNLGKITDEGALFKLDGKKILLTPELSIQIQMELGVDMVVVLDDFDLFGGTKKGTEISVDRTIMWAKRSKDEFEKICKAKKIPTSKRPLILGVVQGGRFADLRKYCTQELVKIGFDGLGYGGDGKGDKGINYEMSKVIANNSPKNYLLYGLGLGKPEDIVTLVGQGFTIFDCVLPTRDARHGRMYIYNAKTIDEIDVSQKDFYEFYVPAKTKNLSSNEPVSEACDCLTCKRYTRGYLAHLFKIGDFTAGRLATIHNLRFYSILMEKLSKLVDLD
ncbi:MAG: tRNA guanosine(34) transglycosylase Tgt [bacterium]|nr:MAG: tRNA guanosine(34) transglycosylase Tgt [bacterium]